MNNDFENKNNEEHEPGMFLPVHVGPVRKPFRRSRSNRIFLGLCGGIAEYLRIDASLIRIVFAVSILIGGWGVIAYLVAAAMIPVEAADISDISINTKTETANMKLLIGNLLLLTGAFFTFNIYGIVNYFSFVGIPPEIFGSITLIFIGVFIYNKRNTATQKRIIKTGLRRSPENKRIAGFCGGLAEYMNTDSSAVRMLWLIFTFATMGLGFILYFIMWIVIPPDTVNNE